MLFKEPWQPGMFCLSIYKEDGEAYEGLVKSIEGSDADGGQYAVVQFIGKSPFEIFLCWKHIRNRHFSLYNHVIIRTNCQQSWQKFFWEIMFFWNQVCFFKRIIIKKWSHNVKFFIWFFLWINNEESFRRLLITLVTSDAVKTEPDTVVFYYFLWFDFYCIRR